MTELDQRKRALQRKRQRAVDRGRPTVFFDKLISATQRKINEVLRAQESSDTGAGQEQEVAAEPGESQERTPTDNQPVELLECQAGGVA